MRWRECYIDLLDAWADVCSRPFRSSLSAVGISVGVLALVAMMSITGGARKQALAGAQSLGLDKVRIERLELNSPAQSSKRSPGLSMNDATAIDHRSGVDVETTFYHRQTNIGIQSKRSSTHGDVLIVGRNFFAVEDLKIARGLPWSFRKREHSDSWDKSPLKSGSGCVIGDQLASELQILISDVLVVNRRPCSISAILAPHPRLLTQGTGLSALDFDRSIFRVHNTVHGFNRDAQITGLVIKISANESFDLAVDAISRVLTSAHHGEVDFLVVVPKAIAAQVNETQRLFSLVMSAIAGLALLVGGIGVANSLLATVAEQTREIGLRMAVGASSQRVLSLYILHALWICGIGAIVGAVFGLLVATLVQVLAGWTLHLSATAVGVGILFALVTGVLSASYPAFRASNMTAASALIDH